MFHSTLSFLTSTLLLTSLVGAQSTSSVGYTGTLSSLDGGLGGTVTVKDADTLVVTSYKLKDASAPALYWWGSTTTKLSSGFRISNTQVTSAASSDTLTIPLDAGKNASTFGVVGLWCERLNANFGQAELKAGDGKAPAATGTGSAPAPTESKKEGAAGRVEVAVGMVVVAGLIGGLMI